MLDHAFALAVEIMHETVPAAFRVASRPDDYNRAFPSGYLLAILPCRILKRLADNSVVVLEDLLEQLVVTPKRFLVLPALAPETQVRFTIEGNSLTSEPTLWITPTTS